MRLALIILGLIGLLLMGCATHAVLPFYNTPQWNSFYTGGDGNTTEQAVVINTNDDKKIIEAENHYLDNMLTSKGKTYKINTRTAYGVNGKAYDKLEVVIDNSTAREYHFDISKPYGQAMQP